MTEITVEEPLAGYIKIRASALVDNRDLSEAILQGTIEARIETNRHEIRNRAAKIKQAGTRESEWLRIDAHLYHYSIDIIDQIKQGVAGIKAEFWIAPNYDLADELIGAYGDFIRAKQRPPITQQLQNDKKSLEQVHRKAAIWDENGKPIATQGVVMELTLRGNLESLNNPQTTLERGRLRAAIRQSERVKPQHRGGNYPDWPENRLARTLASIYYQGTGKLPASAQKNNKWRGIYMRFAKSCLSLLGVELTDTRISDQMLAMRALFKKQKKQADQ